MPIYEYKCSDCGKTTELLTKTAKNAKIKCPDCGGNMQKLFSVFSAQIKPGESKKCLGCSDIKCPHAGT